MPKSYGPRRVAALHDLSCFGRCALTVILPTLSVMGYQVVPIPTALLSTHTGGFTDLHFRDLTADMERIAEHFETLGVTFDAIYPGFLGSAEQIETVCRFIDRFGRPSEEGNAPTVLVDPVMGDDGALYSTYTRDLVEGVKHLASRAHILTPNLTEACFLTGTPWCDTSVMDEAHAKLFAAELINNLVDTCASLTDTCANGINVFICAVNGNLASRSCFTGYRLDFNGTVEDFGNFAFKKASYKTGMSS